MLNTLQDTDDVLHPLNITIQRDSRTVKVTSPLFKLKKINLICVFCGKQQLCIRFITFDLDKSKRMKANFETSHMYRWTDGQGYHFQLWQAHKKYLCLSYCYSSFYASKCSPLSFLNTFGNGWRQNSRSPYRSKGITF